MPAILIQVSDETMLALKQETVRRQTAAPRYLTKIEREREFARLSGIYGGNTPGYKAAVKEFLGQYKASISGLAAKAVEEKYK